MTANQAAMPRKVLIVEDQVVGLKDHQGFLQRQGIQVFVASDLSTALYQFNHNTVDSVI